MSVTFSPPSPHAPSLLVIAINAASADGDGAHVDVANYTEHQHVTVSKSGTGTVTLNLEGSDDDVAFYPLRYQQMDVEPRGAEADAGIAIGAGTVAHVYEILDRYPIIRPRLSATAGAVVVNATIFAQSAGRI